MTMKALRSRLGAVVISLARQQDLPDPDLAAMGTDEMVEYLRANDVWDAFYEKYLVVAVDGAYYSPAGKIE